MKSKNDAELVHLARAGNRDAYGELIRRYQRPIWGVAYLLIGDRFEAEDMTPEAFLRAWLNFDLLSDPAKFATWLRRIVFGVSIDWLRVFRPDLYWLTDAKAELDLPVKRLKPSPPWSVSKPLNCRSGFRTQLLSCRRGAGCR